MSFGNGRVPPVPEAASVPNGTDRSSRFGLRLAMWYAALFIGSAFAVVLITYLLTSSSLAQRDHEIIQSKLGEYATVYAQGGLQELAATVDAEQRTSRERVFVRVLDRGSEAVLLSNAEGWDPSTSKLEPRCFSMEQSSRSVRARRPERHPAQVPRPAGADHHLDHPDCADRRVGVDAVGPAADPSSLERSSSHHRDRALMNALRQVRTMTRSMS